MTPPAGFTPPPWPYCDDPAGCPGRRVDPYSQCLAHLGVTDRSAYLAGLAPGADVDHSGTVVDNALLAAVLSALRDPATARPRVGDARFVDARFPRGAVFNDVTFTGDARFAGATFTGDAEFAGATFTGGARFDGATFTDARFVDATFTGDARFNGTTFTGAAGFGGVTFTGDADFARGAFAGAAWFGEARFASAGFVDATFATAGFAAATFAGDAGFTNVAFTGAAGFTGVTFTGAAEFAGATFTGDTEFVRATFADSAEFIEARFTRVWFDHARFPGSARFVDAAFTGHTRFIKATFAGDAVFNGATFTTAEFDDITIAGDARFVGATFTGDTRFCDATFSGVAEFARATFTSETEFARATFTGAAGFAGAIFTGDAWFPDATFTGTPVLGPLVSTHTVHLSGAVFGIPVTIEAAAAAVVFRRTRWDATATLRLRYAQVDLTDAVVTQPLAIATHPEPFRGAGAAETLLLGGRPHTVTVASLRGVDAAFLALTDTDLSRCRFTGAFHLDQIHLDGRTVFADAPSGTHWRRGIPWRRTGRRTLAEEHAWRALEHPPVNPAAPTATEWRPGPDHPRRALTPGPDDVAPLYRALRKAFEDAKNEPDAADFYYGEMEMRRHDRERPRAERGLLAAYWALSGYGLRASRALTWLAVTMTTTIFALTLWGLPTHDPKPLTTGTQAAPGQPVRLTTDNPEPELRGPYGHRITAERVEKAGRVVLTSVVFRSSGQNLTRAGTYTEMLSRFFEPVLLALAVLAIRGRVKR